MRKKTKKPKVPTPDEIERCLEIRRKSKRGDSGFLYNRDAVKFINYMLRQYPEWYDCTEKRIWNETLPAGSEAYVKEGNCEDEEYLVAHH